MAIVQEELITKRTGTYGVGTVPFIFSPFPTASNLIDCRLIIAPHRTKFQIKLSPRSGIETSNVEPEPDFFAGTGAGEKEPAPACCYVI